DQERAAIEVADLLRQVAEVLAVLVDPRVPERGGARDDARRRLLAHVAVEIAHLAVALAGADPVVDVGAAVRLERGGDRNRRIDRPLLDRVHRQHAVLGVAPRPLLAADAAAPARVLLDAPLLAGAGADEEVALRAVLDDAA